jgi:hypothetical protein
MGKRKVFSLLRFGAPLLAGRLSPAREKRKGENKMEIDFNNLPLAKRKSASNPYASASYAYQNMINGVSEEMAKQQEEDARDNAHLVNHDLDVALPSYEQDDDYSEDRYPQYGEESVQLYY